MVSPPPAPPPFRQGGPPPPPSRTPPSPLSFEGHAHSLVEFRDCLASERIVVVVGFLDRECEHAVRRGPWLISVILLGGQ